MSRLLDKQVLDVEWAINNRSYNLRVLESWKKQCSINGELTEDVAWREDIKGLLPSVPSNVSSMWHYGITKVFNNVIDHSGGSEVCVRIKKTTSDVECIAVGDGVGIFENLKKQFRLLDERHAVLELSKGKLTTNPQSHLGQGIFFTSRMFDEFTILSGETFFSHNFGESEDWTAENGSFKPRTMISMKLNNQASRTGKDVFDQFDSSGDYSFSKTIVPVRLALYENENLMSRSQAKRLMARIENFEKVFLDFRKVEEVGQAFADEVFRVFPSEHQNTDVIAVNANKAVRQMIASAQS